MVPWLEDLGDFPHSQLALTHLDEADGLLCASAQITAEHLKRSYPRGIYPWYNVGDPVLWWAPSQRAVLFTAEFKCHKSLRKTLARWQNSGRMQVRVDTAFSGVLSACANRSEGTWMTPELQAAYSEWYLQGAVHSIETWIDGELQGGLYGVGLGRMFFGESMFSRQTDMSKIALACFIQWFESEGGDVLDCQQDTAHLLGLGARTIARVDFEQLIEQRTQQKAPDWLAARGLDLLAIAEV
jgi:leucyl/phenylalanyl-tRNA---protein transferase